jgi:hypothetical protein
MDVSHAELTQIPVTSRPAQGQESLYPLGAQVCYIMADPDPTFLRECASITFPPAQGGAGARLPRCAGENGQTGREVYDAFVQRYHDINEKWG